MQRLFLVECFWPGISAAELAAAVERVSGAGICCVDLILIPSDEIALGIFEGPSAAAVHEATLRAGMPSERVIESIRVAPRLRPEPSLRHGPTTTTERKNL